MLPGIPGLSSPPCPESPHPLSPLLKSIVPLPRPLPPPPNGCRVLHKGSGQDTTNPFKQLTSKSPDPGPKCLQRRAGLPVAHITVAGTPTLTGKKNFSGQGGEGKKNPNCRGRRFKVQLTNPTCVRNMEALMFWPMEIKMTTDQIRQGYKWGPAGGHFE